MNLMNVSIITSILLVSFNENKELEYMKYKDFYQNVEIGNIEKVLIEDDNVKFNIFYIY